MAWRQTSHVEANVDLTKSQINNNKNLSSLNKNLHTWEVVAVEVPSPAYFPA